MPKQAVLLVNLGSPDSTAVKDVRRYLDEFLSDDRVLDIPKPLQQLLLKVAILPKRSPRSAHAYSTIWTPEGSPLLVISRRLQTLVQAEVEVPVALAMRYGNPSIPEVVGKLIDDGVSDLFLVPLYPHYAMSSYETVVVRVHEVLRERASPMRVSALQPFYSAPEYIEALYLSAAADLDGGYDYVLFSYHGLPQRHLRKADSSRAHCTRVPDCCHVCSPAHATCYRAQTVQSTEALVRRAGIPDGKWSISYQSRLAGEPWLLPYTDHELVRLGQRGVQRLLVLTPAFVSDCLETLEEIAITGRRTFLEAGGGSFKHVPCMNDHPAWVAFLVQQIDQWRGRTAAVAGPALRN